MSLCERLGRDRVSVGCVSGSVSYVVWGHPCVSDSCVLTIESQTERSASVATPPLGSSQAGISHVCDCLFFSLGC